MPLVMTTAVKRQCVKTLDAQLDNAADCIGCGVGSTRESRAALAGDPQMLERMQWIVTRKKWVQQQFATLDAIELETRARHKMWAELDDADLHGSTYKCPLAAAQAEVLHAGCPSCGSHDHRSANAFLCPNFAGRGGVAEGVVEDMEVQVSKRRKG
jgi:hypothetical protein